MSAFIVHPAHIDALVTFAIKARASYYFANDRHYITDHTAQQIGRTLMAENVASVAYRYRDSDDMGETEAYRFHFFQNGLTPVEVIKAAHCLAYQSCEHPGWEASEANAILEAIKDAACHKLAGYDAAPWGIDSDSKSRRRAA